MAANGCVAPLVMLGLAGVTAIDCSVAAVTVNTVEQITYPVRNGVIHRGKRAKIITERAVLEVAAEGLVLTEVAKGVDVRKDIIEQMEFAPARIVDRPKTMDAALFAHQEN